MKTYKVTVNGTAYEITLEAIDAADVKAAPAAAPAPAATPAPAPAAAPAPVATAAPAGAESVLSPMPGTILSVNVQNGASVKKGDVLMILEAMKMENEIMAPCDGVVSSVIANKTAVDSGTVLCVIG